MTATPLRGCLSSLLLCALFAPLQAATVLAVNVDDVIHPITAEILSNVRAQAEADGAAAILIRLNTPGGLLDATREITETIVASKVPVIAYVTPSGGRAASAGFFILQSADLAAMAPGTNTGAASPVLLNGEMDETMRKKVEQDTSAWLRSLVGKRGRNVDLAIETITDARAFTEKESLDDHLIDLVAANQAKLLEALNGREFHRFDGRTETLDLTNPQVIEYQPSWRERIISSVANPNIGFILLIAGALGLYVEFSAPGLIGPGVLGGILLLLGLSSLAVLPINWVGAALLALSIVLFVLEAHYTSHGVLGLGGTVSMILGALLLINGPPELRITLTTALAVTLPFAAITMFLLALVVQSQRNKSVAGVSGMLGQVGVARTALAPSGMIFVHGEYWEADSAHPVEIGGKVEVVGIEGLRLKVKPRPPAAAPPSEI